MGLDGIWKVAIDSSMDERIVPRSAQLTLVQAGAGLEGSMSAPYPMGDDVAIHDGRVDADRVEWKVAMTGDRIRPQILEFEGTLTDGALSGKVEVGIFGTAEFRATPA